jgi:hypothetical protein
MEEINSKLTSITLNFKQATETLIPLIQTKTKQRQIIQLDTILINRSQSNIIIQIQSLFKYIQLMKTRIILNDYASLNYICLKEKQRVEGEIKQVESVYEEFMKELLDMSDGLEL